MRPSAAAISPASSSRISPGTRESAEISSFSPSRSTRAWGADIAFRLSRDFCALKCCTVPRIAFRISTVIITIVPSQPPVSAEMIAAISRITTSKSANCSANTRSTLFCLPSISLFSPYCASRFCASPPLRPCASV